MSGSFFGSYFRRMHREEAQNPRPEGEASAAPAGAEAQETPRAPAVPEPEVSVKPPEPALEPVHEAKPAPEPDSKLAVRATRNGSVDSPRPPAAKNSDAVGVDESPTTHDPRPTISVERDDQKPAARTPQPQSTIDDPPSTPAGDSPLDGLMRDKIVVALLQQDILSVPQALVALQRQKKTPEKALWRLAADMAEVDSDALYARAAELQGYKIAHFTPGKPSDEFIEAVQGLFTPALTERMRELGILPYDFVMHPDETKNTLVFVTHDPGHPEVQEFAARLGVEVELRFASASLVSDRIRRMLNKAGAPTRVEERKEAVRQDSVHARSNESAGNGKPQEHEAEKEEELSASHDDPEIEFINVTDTITPEDLRRLLGTDVETQEEVLVDEDVKPSAVDPHSGDGIPGDEPPIQASSNLETHGDENDADAAAEQSEAWQDETSSFDSEEAPTPQSTSDDPPSTPEPEPAEDAAPVEPVNLDAIKSKDRVVAALLKKQVINAEHVSRAEHHRKKEGSKEALWRLIAQEKGVDRDAVFIEAARVYAFPIAKMGEGQPDADFARSVIDTFSEEKRDELFRLRILPYECDLEHQTGAIKLVFITHDPTRPEVNRLMQQLRLERFELRYAPESIVTRGLGEAFPKRNKYLERVQEGGGAVDLGTSYEDKSNTIDEDALEAEINRSTLINLFEATLVEAVRQGASDVHIYPNASHKTEIHFRVDGRLGHWHTEDKVHPEALLAVIKDNAINVDRFERDAAQDGFIQRWIDEALIRFRVSVLPIANASQELRSESIVIRVLDDRAVITDLGRLGLLKDAHERFDHAIRQPHGMVILTGPTGSGKSTTLVAALHQVVTPEVNVLTVEDPVEYIIPGVRQIKLNHKLGLEAALRSILRHDPDIVMVGEMRDRETAELAIKLANTGHLTFSTLHTNDAPAAISRLYKMGVEPFLIAYAINLVVAQRLIRNLCPTCKRVDDDPDHVMLQKLGFTDEDIASTTIYTQGSDPNCKTCHGTGFKGRRAICEALYFSRTIRHMIVEANAMIDEESIRDQARKEGMLTLSDSAREIVKMGETSVREMIRVVTTES